MQIRQANLDDAAAISLLICPLTEKYIAAEFSSEARRILLDSMTPNAVEGYLRSGYCYHLAEDQEMLAGVVGMRPGGHLYHLFVSEPYQGRGLARRLWDVSREAALLADPLPAFTVNSSRLAVDVYRKFGFVETGPPETKDGVTYFPMKYTVKGDAMRDG